MAPAAAWATRDDACRRFKDQDSARTRRSGIRIEEIVESRGLENVERVEDKMTRMVSNLKKHLTGYLAKKEKAEKGFFCVPVTETPEDANAGLRKIQETARARRTGLSGDCWVCCFVVLVGCLS